MKLFQPLALVCCVCFSCVAVDAHTPVEFLEVFDGKPLTEIEHSIEVKSVLEDAKRMIDLSGPNYFSISVGCLGREAKEKVYLAWYGLTNSRETSRRDVKVLDFVRGMKADALTIGAAEFFLSPAQRITTGPPSEIPEGLDHYIAYRVIDAPARKLDVQLTGAAGPSERLIGRPIFLCVSAEEWHHEEYFPATHPSGCFVVFELAGKAIEGQFSFIDQFGLNQLEANESRWLCVRGALSDQ